MNGKIGKASRRIDTVKLFKTLDLGSGDFRYLRFVRVQGGDRFRDGAIADDFAKCFDDVLRARERGAAGHMVLAYTECGSKIAPEFRVRCRSGFLLPRGFPLRCPVDSLRFGLPEPKVLRKSFDVTIILCGIKL